MVKSSTEPDMQAIVVNAFGGPDVLVEQRVPLPEPHEARCACACAQPVSTRW